jgi:hypothetical protein
MSKSACAGEHIRTEPQRYLVTWTRRTSACAWSNSPTEGSSGPVKPPAPQSCKSTSANSRVSAGVGMQDLVFMCSPSRRDARGWLNASGRAGQTQFEPLMARDIGLGISRYRVLVKVRKTGASKLGRRVHSWWAPTIELVATTRQSRRSCRLDMDKASNCNEQIADFGKTQAPQRRQSCKVPDSVCTGFINPHGDCLFFMKSLGNCQKRSAPTGMSTELEGRSLEETLRLLRTQPGPMPCTLPASKTANCQ